MQVIKITDAEALMLDGVAEVLMWLEFDRAADMIYALINPDSVEPIDASAGQWADVFAG